MASAVKIYKHFEMPKEVGVYHRLICLTGDDKGKAYFLMGKRVVMGRSENCDVTILDLKSSREHVEIILVGRNYILTDLGSQNGVVVNDLKVKQHALSNGDKIIIGKTVYKFSKIEVKESNEKIIKNQRERNRRLDAADDEDEEDEEEPKNNRLTLILGAVILIGIMLMIGDETSEKPIKRVTTISNNIGEIDRSFERANNKRIKESKKNKAKLQIYFKRGLREFREGNYFRAINEFESAKQWSPNDPLANFYLRKTREALDEEIESYFSKATRDIDSINYMAAVTSYCAVIRLLADYKSDSRFLAAQVGVKSLEQKMGLDEDEIQCLDVKGDK
jgi:pSer/pThr/pTyr-binding forkhead associated (FHA) protein